MNAKGLRILLAPASGPRGSGEYYRCLTLAREIRGQDESAEIAFLLHRQARVECDERFDYYILEATPARAGERVIDLIHKLRPDVAVFDHSGRVRQMQVARNLGARVVWISNRPRKRLKGFRARQLRWQDLHVVIDDRPNRRLRLFERALLACFPDSRAELSPPVVPRADATALEPWREQLPAPGTGAIFIPGGGGYQLQNRPVPEIFLEAAAIFRRESGRPAVVVMGPQYAGAVDSHPQVTVIPQLPAAGVGALLSEAKLAVIGAGSMLSAQALAAGRPLVLAALGGRDQPARVRRLARAGAAIGAEPDADRLAAGALRIEREPELARELCRQMQQWQAGDAASVISAWILALARG